MNRILAPFPPRRALMAANLVDYVQVTLFPVITGQTGLNPIYEGASDFDLELVEHRTLDGHTQELIKSTHPAMGRRDSRVRARAGSPFT